MAYNDYSEDASPRLRFGKYKGHRIDEIPLSYCAWLYDEGRIDNELREQLKREIAARIGASLEPSSSMSRCLPAPGVDEAARAIIANGYRKVSLERHPDRGGDHRQMVAATDARDYLMRAIDLGVAV